MEEQANFKSERSTVRRVPKRAHYDAATVFSVLDANFVGQVAFQLEGQPFQIPMLYGREGNVLYLHGSKKSRIYQTLARGIPCSLGVTLVDGIVVARSAFHHSVNYRSVVVFGRCAPVGDPEEKLAVFERFTDAIIPGRWAECRPINAKEAKVTGILALTIEDASAKIRTGGPVDETADYDLPIWAGVVPLETTYGVPVEDQNSKITCEVPGSVRELVNDK
ncbi:pyridoxamine 5'-phosphate oxidase family protein [Lewinella sp. JB7]|uniref:pyridoxamine 5'-phosphate oxidase family protein n=1 Tax=Lewinella sp. JB7 TaxID=2962887 RepID=UPI0020C9CDA7|nr:pyridoxamine 5'-phosphate oxidase family protein [Lewinella sp. JB7]MCP9235266.1 pyridoxamine 5'-phosphate oxidase family protein [Lewinella sp. JB7]